VGDIEHLDFPFQTFGERAVKVIAKPIEGFLPILVQTKDKAISDFTMIEILAWAAVGIYGVMIGTVITHVTANVVMVLVRGPAPRR